MASKKPLIIYCFTMVMATGYSYVAPFYREIDFDSRDIEGARVGLVVPVPKRHKIMGQYRSVELDRPTEHLFAGVVPTGPNMMYINQM